jgi:hypothetical protein
MQVLPKKKKKKNRMKLSFAGIMDGAGDHHVK